MNSYVSWEIIEKLYVRPTALNRWLENFYIEYIDWPSIFMQPYLSSRETKLQSLQYKIIHRIFPCQKWLYNHKVITSPNCLHCNEVDNLIHYFVECRGVNDFWSQLESWWNRLTKVQVSLTQKHILFSIGAAGLLHA